MLRNNNKKINEWLPQLVKEFLEFSAWSKPSPLTTQIKAEFICFMFELYLSTKFKTKFCFSKDEIHNCVINVDEFEKLAKVISRIDLKALNDYFYMFRSYSDRAKLTSQTFLVRPSSSKRGNIEISYLGVAANSQSHEIVCDLDEAGRVMVFWNANSKFDFDSVSEAIDKKFLKEFQFTVPAILKQGRQSQSHISIAQRRKYLMQEIGKYLPDQWQDIEKRFLQPLVCPTFFVVGDLVDNFQSDLFVAEKAKRVVTQLETMIPSLKQPNLSQALLKLAEGCFAANKFNIFRFYSLVQRFITQYAQSVIKELEENGADPETEFDRIFIIARLKNTGLIAPEHFNLILKAQVYSILCGRNEREQNEAILYLMQDMNLNENLPHEMMIEMVNYLLPLLANQTDFKLVDLILSTIMQQNIPKQLVGEFADRLSTIIDETEADKSGFSAVQIEKNRYISQCTTDEERKQLTLLLAFITNINCLNALKLALAICPSDPTKLPGYLNFMHGLIKNMSNMHLTEAEILLLKKILLPKAPAKRSIVSLIIQNSAILQQQGTPQPKPDTVMQEKPPR